MKNIFLLAGLAFLGPILFAQNVGIGTNNPQAPLTVAPNRTVLFGADTLNAGTKLMWLPAKAAFRVGLVDDNIWDAGNIAQGSFAAGYNTRASGNYSIATGGATSASGNYSTAMGGGTNASGVFATALGSFTIASGNRSTAMGSFTDASGDRSTAMGRETTASGDVSTAMGGNTIAVGSYSTAMGYYTWSSGEKSTAMGDGTNARAYSSLVIGRYNDSIASSSPVTWVATDPLMILGNGTADNARKNALVVYKNGNTDINGFTRLGEATEAAPKIKMKELTLTSSPIANGQSPINHGLNSSKIISVSALMEWTPGFFAPIEYSPDPLLRYNYFISPTQIIIQNNAANCTYICNKPVKVLITYKE